MPMSTSVCRCARACGTWAGVRGRVRARVRVRVRVRVRARVRVRVRVGLEWVPASSPPERSPVTWLSPPETAVAPEGVGGRKVWPVRSCEPKPLEPCDEPLALLQAAVPG